MLVIIKLFNPKTFLNFNKLGIILRSITELSFRLYVGNKV